MANKHLLSGTAILLGINTLSAQAPAAALQGLETQEAAIINTVQLLEQHALTALIAVVVLTGLACIGYVCHACLGLNKPQHSAHTQPKSILLFVFGLGVLCSQCSPAQLARATEIRAAQSLESRACLSSQHAENLENTRMNYHNPTRSQYAAGYFFTCKYCGQRVFIHR